ncbi:MAG: lipopolysaccharide biosynthesis protein [Hydrogenophilaceae bacterium]|nr:lipopolysaccharide biosynthesis protein [Hydrogenophilaceae bacterium]
MAQQYEMTLRDYLSIARRRAPHLAIAFTAIFTVSIVVAIVLPPTYRATGTILVESQQIPDDIVRSTITSYVDERIAVIKQRVLTRANLLKIMDKYDLFKDEDKVASSELLDKLRERVKIETIGADLGKAGQATIAFKLSFDAKEPDTAYRMANELVTLFLDENVKSRTARASETTEFLSQEAERLRQQLEKAENDIASYKQRYGNALPEHLDLRMAMITRLEGELKDVERELKAAQEELRYLDIELTGTKTGLLTTGSTPPSPAQQLFLLKKDYEKASAIYKETHPDVRALKRQIEALEGESAGRPGETKAGAGKPIAGRPDQDKRGAKVDEDSFNQFQDLSVAKIEARITAAEARQKSLIEQRKEIKSKLAQYEREIMQTPQVERGMIAMQRDYDNAKTKYEEVRAKQMGAQISENLEEEKKAERFSLIEPPLLPDKPIEPNRKKLVAMGFFLALAGAGGLVMLLESIHQRVRGPRALAALAGEPPLVSIPYITTREERTRRKSVPRFRLKLFVGGGLVLFIAALLAVHFFYKPLDILFYMILDRFI